MANINDIAKITGFSKSTISRYLNNGSVSRNTSEKIRKAIEKLNYEPNIFARSLKLNKTNTIGVVIPNFIGYSKNISLMAINQYLDESEYRILLSCSNDNMKNEISILEELINLHVDGIILFASDVTQEHKKFFENAKTPICIIGQQVENQNYLVHDDYQAGKIIGENILKSNHKEITYFDILDYDKAIKLRFDGLKDTLADSDIKINRHKVSFELESSYKKLLEVFGHEKSTYYIGATDNIAYGILKALHELNISVPDDVSVSGFGDYEISQIVYPGLSTIRFNYKEIGIQACKNLISIIEDNNISQIQKKFGCEFVKRRSSR